MTCLSFLIGCDPQAHEYYSNELEKRSQVISEVTIKGISRSEAGPWIQVQRELVTPPYQRIRIKLVQMSELLTLLNEQLCIKENYSPSKHS